MRNSIENPRVYFESNMSGSFELLEAVRQHPVEHLLIASTSSAYGANRNFPFRIIRLIIKCPFMRQQKKQTKLLLIVIHIFTNTITMFRFFTVYGPWGRPDMALFKFTKAILEGNEIDVYNYGEMDKFHLCG